MSLLCITNPSRTSGTDDWKRGSKTVLFCSPSGLKFSGSFDKGDFSTNVCVENCFEGKNLSEEGMEFEIYGLHREVVIGGNTSSRLRRQRHNESRSGIGRQRKLVIYRCCNLRGRLLGYQDGFC